MKNRRRNFLINRPFQFRHMAYITLTLVAVTATLITSLYFGIWGSILDVFSDARIRQDIITASQLSDYEAARFPAVSGPKISFLKQTEKLTERQREIFKEILDETNRKLIPKLLLLLFFIAWGSIYISHKLAGPLFRFQATLKEMENGNFKIRVRLRKGDETHFVETNFNRALETLDGLFSRIKKILRQDVPAEQIKADLNRELENIKTSADS